MGMDENSQHNDESDIMPPPSSTIPMDMQTSTLHASMNDSACLAAVKAELLEDASQSSSFMTNESAPQMQTNTSPVASYSQGSPEMKTVLSPQEMYQDNSNGGMPSILQMSIQQPQAQQQMTYQDILTTRNEILDMKIKSENARRDSSSMDGATFAMTQQQILNHSPPQMMTHSPPLHPQLMVEQSMAQGQPLFTQIPMTTTVDQYTVTTNAGTSIELMGGNVVIREQIVNPMTMACQDRQMSQSIMCPQMTASHQPPQMIQSSSVVNNVLLDMAGQNATSQQQHHLTPSPPAENPGINMRHNTSPVAVKKMILNAAAEILTTPQPSAETQATINALIAMNSSDAISTTNAHQTNNSNHLNMYATSTQPTHQTIVSQNMTLQTQMQTEPDHSSVVVSNQNILLTSQLTELNDSLR